MTRTFHKTLDDFILANKVVSKQHTTHVDTPIQIRHPFLSHKKTVLGFGGVKRGSCGINGVSRGPRVGKRGARDGKGGGGSGIVRGWPGSFKGVGGPRKVKIILKKTKTVHGHYP